MTVKRTKELIDEILSEEMVEIGIFLSLLSHEFVKQTGLTERQFLKTLKRSLKICNEKDYLETKDK